MNKKITYFRIVLSGCFGGPWNIRTNDPITDSDSVLEFDPAGKTVYASAGADRYIRAGTKLFSSNDSSGITDDAIRFTAYEAADDLIAQYGDNMMIYSSDMQYLAGIYEDEESLRSHSNRSQSYSPCE